MAPDLTWGQGKETRTHPAARGRGRGPMGGRAAVGYIVYKR